MSHKVCSYLLSSAVSKLQLTASGRDGVKGRRAASVQPIEARSACCVTSRNTVKGRHRQASLPILLKGRAQTWPGLDKDTAPDGSVDISHVIPSEYRLYSTVCVPYSRLPSACRTSTYKYRTTVVLLSWI